MVRFFFCRVYIVNATLAVALSVYLRGVLWNDLKTHDHLFSTFCILTVIPSLLFLNIDSILSIDIISSTEKS